MKRVLNATGIPSWLVPVGTNRTDSLRPVGVTVIPYSDDKCLAWEATCVHTYSASCVINCAVAPGCNDGAAEERKWIKHQGITDKYLFEPDAIETTEVLGSGTRMALHHLGKR